MKRWKVDLSIIAEANESGDLAETLLDVVASAPSVQEVGVVNLERIEEA